MKAKTLFYCTECGNETAKWAGKCPACGAWNTIVEQPERPKGTGKGASVRVGMTRRRACPVTDLTADEEIRFPTGMGELDRVLGGGAVKGSLVLVGGAPGIGKSTLMLQICSKLCEFSKVLYISGEESEHQLKLRAKRLHVESQQLLVLSETNLGDVLEAVNTEQPDVLIVDSIQTLYNDALDAAVRQRLTGYPLHYILGEWNFFGCRFRVSPACLIPRPDTEVLVEAGLERVEKGAVVADLCTGSGCIATALLVSSPDIALCAGLELFPETLALAQENAARNGVGDRFLPICADLLTDGADRLHAALRGRLPERQDARLDMILSNPPYIRRAELPVLHRSLPTNRGRRWMAGRTDLRSIAQSSTASVTCSARAGGCFWR